MFRVLALILLLSAPAVASTGIAVEATPNTKLFAELSIVSLVTQGNIDVYDAIVLQPAKRPQLTVAFDRINSRLRVRVLDEKSRTILSQFEIADNQTNAYTLRAQARSVAQRILAATMGPVARN